MTRAKDWRDQIKKGDMLATLAGDREVLDARYDSNGYLSGITMQKIRKSWTSSATTGYTRSDIKGMGMRPKYEPHPFSEAGGITPQVFQELVEADITMRHAADWHEDDGAVVWYKLPEPYDCPPDVYCGTPLDSDWPGDEFCWWHRVPLFSGRAEQVP